MCAISWKRLIVERNGKRFCTRGTTVHIGRALLMPDSLSLVWGHLVHFAKFPMLRFSKGYCSQFSSSTKFYCKYVGHERIQAATVATVVTYGILIFLLTQSYGGWKLQHAIPLTVFIRAEPNSMINTAVIGEYKVKDILTVCQKIKILWHFESLA